MTSSHFQFRKFQIQQHHCAMKVTRDACLLGAWADVAPCHKLLDIGTGTGLLSLMCAQRSHAAIDAIELDQDAAKQACANFTASPWGGRIQLHQQSLQHWLQTATIASFDGIISNPPFFNDSLRCPNPARNRARHTDQLDYPTLINAIDRLLSSEGNAWLLLPTDAIERFVSLLPSTLFMHQLCHIAHSAQHRSKRALLALSRQSLISQEQRLCLFDEDGQYTSEARALLSPYYLRFASGGPASAHKKGLR